MKTAKTPILVVLGLFRRFLVGLEGPTKMRLTSALLHESFPNRVRLKDETLGFLFWQTRLRFDY